MKEREYKRREQYVKEKKSREQLKREQIEKEKAVQERWALLNWVTEHIAENSSKWEKEYELREVERKKTIEDWERKSRFEKIAHLKEKLRKKTVHPVRKEEEKLAPIFKNMQRKPNITKNPAEKFKTIIQDSQTSQPTPPTNSNQEVKSRLAPIFTKIPKKTTKAPQVAKETPQKPRKCDK